MLNTFDTQQRVFSQVKAMFVMYAQVSSGCVNWIRKFVLRAARLRDLVELGGLTAQDLAFLEASAWAGLSMLAARRPASRKPQADLGSPATAQRHSGRMGNVRTSA